MTTAAEQSTPTTERIRHDGTEQSSYRARHRPPRPEGHRPGPPGVSRDPRGSLPNRPLHELVDTRPRTATRAPPPCFEVVVDVHHPLDELYTTGSVPAAGAVWVPPGDQPTAEETEEVTGWYAEAAQETAPRLLSAMELMNENHPNQPHAYLFLMGTRPHWQCRGLGSALLRKVLDRCDREGTPAYLEATSPENRRLYLRHGFVITGEIGLPDGPSLWPMWREPTPAK